MKKYLVYSIVNKVNNKKYIGFTSTSLAERWRRHLDKSKNEPKYAIHQALKKYGNENFIMKELYSYENLDEALLCEILLILYFNTKAPNGYNLTDGGEGTFGVIRSSSWRKKKSLSMKGKVPSNRLKVTRNDGKEYASITHAAKDVGADVSAISNNIHGNLNTVKGYSFSAVDKEIKSQQDGKRACRDSLKNKQKKKIVDNFGNVYDSLSEAARKLNISVSNLCSVLKGKRNMTGNRSFKYVE